MLDTDTLPLNLPSLPRGWGFQVSDSLPAKPLLRSYSYYLPHGDLIRPDAPDLGRVEIRDLSPDVARRNRVGPGEAHPLYAETPTHVDDRRLGSVVGRLQLWDIDDMPAHARRGDEAAVRVTLEVASVGRGPLGLLAPDEPPGRPRAVCCAVQIVRHNLFVVVQAAVEEGTLLPRQPGFGYEHVQPTVKLTDDAVDGGLDGVVRRNVHLICLA